MKKLLLTLLITLGLTGCASNLILDDNKPKSMPVVDYVDLDRFMGDWYVIATIPTFLERDAYNPIETYQLNSDGTIFASPDPSLVIKVNSEIKVEYSY